MKLHVDIFTQNAQARVTHPRLSYLPFYYTRARVSAHSCCVYILCRLARFYPQCYTSRISARVLQCRRSAAGIWWNSLDCNLRCLLKKVNLIFARRVCCFSFSIFYVLFTVKNDFMFAKVLDIWKRKNKCKRIFFISNVEINCEIKLLLNRV